MSFLVFFPIMKNKNVALEKFGGIQSQSAKYKNGIGIFQI